jgi:hypothetical protein
MKLFGKRNKSAGYFPDDDLDPWGTPSVSFFKDKKHRKIRRLPTLDRNNFRELSFSQLDESYSKISKARLSRDDTMDEHGKRSDFAVSPSERAKFEFLQTSAARGYDARAGVQDQCEQIQDMPNVKINPSQRMFDVYPARPTVPKFIHAQTDSISPHATPQYGDRGYGHEEIVPEYREPVPEHREFTQDYRDQDRGRDHEYQEQNHPEYVAHPRGKKNDQRQSIPNEYISRDYRFLAKVALTGGVFICCGLILWWIGQQSKSDLDEIVAIPSPKNFKIPNDKQIVPFQDALIYGKLDDQTAKKESTETGERLLQTPKLPESLLEGQSALGENSMDEYLDVPQGGFLDDTPKRGYRDQTPKDSAHDEMPALASQKTAHSKVVHLPQEKQQAASFHASKDTYLQIGTLLSADAAAGEMVRLMKKYKILSGRSITVSPFTTADGRVVYRLLVGPLSSNDVKSIAATLNIEHPQRVSNP